MSYILYLIALRLPAGNMQLIQSFMFEDWIWPSYDNGKTRDQSILGLPGRKLRKEGTQVHYTCPSSGHSPRIVYMPVIAMAARLHACMLAWLEQGDTDLQPLLHLVCPWLK
jgi:hypothetical protein